jgi:flavin-dependent dehydrogenase
MSTDYDAIVVGARCAGSPTAMLLARKGYRVLLVDRATFPSDTISTHLIHPPGVAALKRWNLLERVHRTGCPPIESYSFDFGPFTIAGALRPADGASHGLCPRRIVLDAVLVEAAVEAGAELYDGFAVDEILTEHDRVTGIRGHRKGGPAVTQRARVVVGADGMHSLVAHAVQAPRYHERPTISVGYYAYWSGLPTDRFEAYLRPRRGFAIGPTNDGLTMGVVNWPHSEFASNRGDIEGHCLKAFALAPALSERMGRARRVSRYVGTGDLPNFFRQPYGPGWALVGDAGYHKDPMTAQGISDAFRGAEALAHALDDVFSGRLSFDDAMARYQRVRDETAMPMFELTCQFANLEEPPPPELQQRLIAIQGDQEAMSGFISMLAGVVPPSEFFGPERQTTFSARSSSMR